MSAPQAHQIERERRGTTVKAARRSRPVGFDVHPRQPTNRFQMLAASQADVIHGLPFVRAAALGRRSRPSGRPRNAPESTKEARSSEYGDCLQMTRNRHLGSTSGSRRFLSSGHRRFTHPAAVLRFQPCRDQLRQQFGRLRANGAKLH